MRDLPSGTVTFLYTDIEGSTQLLYRLGERFPQVLADHQRLLREAFALHRGHEVGTQGDAFLVSFTRATDAVDAAVEGQRALAAYPWPDDALVRVRMGLLTGEPQVLGDDYTGIDVHRAARIAAAGHGGQVLLAGSTRVLVEGELRPGLALRDLGEHRLKDLQRPEHITQLLIGGLSVDFPPLRSLNEFPNNLPLQLTSFVGRTEEIATVRRLLTATRLLTLTGPGGTGKTRLSLQVAAELLDGFPNGVWLVELAPLSDPSLVAQATLAALGLREQAGRPVMGVLVDFLHAKQCLLLLDNCEHLIEAAAQFADALLRACPELRILASSREPLGVGGETAYRLPSLALPGDSGPRSVDELLASPAVRLFVDRAQAARPAFTLTTRNAPAVVQICRRLDGIPLAIELAAARLRALTVEQIAEHLDDRFRLLTGGSRTVMPRHQTLRALIDWSYDLLPQPERVLLRRLSVFSAGWTLEAAEAVCSGPEQATLDGLESADVLDLLIRLVDKSLVVVDERDLEPRYRLLETIRQYARDRLFEAGESAVVRDRHLAFFAHMADEVEPMLFGLDSKLWLDRLEADHDNLRTAMEWALETDVCSALCLSGRLHEFLARRAHSLEGQRWCRDALSAAERLSAGPQDPAASPEFDRCRLWALLSLAQTSFAIGDFLSARAPAQDAIRLATQFSEPPARPFAFTFHALACSFAGDLDDARASLAEGEAVARSAHDRLGLLRILSVRGRLEGETERDYPAARATAQEAIGLARALGSQWDLAMTTMGLGVILCMQGDFAGGWAMLEESMDIFVAGGDRLYVNMVRGAMANQARWHGDENLALELLGRAIAEWQTLGNRGAIARCLECYAFIARTQAAACDSATDRLALLERMARLCGAAEMLREAAQGPMTPEEQVEYAAEVAAARAAADTSAFTAAWEAGRKLSEEQAIAYAMS